MKKVIKVFILAYFLVGFALQAEAQGTIVLTYQSRHVSGSTWKFDLYATGGSDYGGPEQNNWQGFNIRMDIAVPAGVSVVSGSGTGNPIYTTGLVGVQAAVPGFPPAGSCEMGLTLARDAQTDLTALGTPVLLGSFEVLFSGPINASDISTPRTANILTGSFWTNLSPIPSTGFRRAFSQPLTFPLPVVFSSFTGSKLNCSALLKWTTSSEVNSSYYIVEASTDGNSFKEVGREPSYNAAIGSSYNVNYSLESGINYYRIKAVDFDGRTAYSTNIVSIKNTCLSSFKIYVGPNPTRDNVTVYGLSGKNTLTVFNNVGQQLEMLTSTTFSKLISVNNYPSGTYIIRIVNQDGTTQNEKFVKN